MPCSRKGVVEYKGAWYCKQHDPAAVEAQRKAREAAQIAEIEAADSSPATDEDAETAAALRLVQLWRNTPYLGEMLYVAPYKFLQPDGEGWRVTDTRTGDFGIYASLALALAAVDGDGEGSESQ